MITKQLAEVLEKAYFTLKNFKNFNGITDKIVEVIGYEPTTTTASYFTGTPVASLAYVWRTIFRTKLEDGTDDDSLDDFYGIMWEVYEALATTPSLTEQDKRDKVALLKEDFTLEELDEHTSVAFKMLEYELTGEASEWGKHSERTPSEPMKKNEQ